MPRYFKMRARDTVCGSPAQYVTWVVQGAPDTDASEVGALPCGSGAGDLADIQVVREWIADDQPLSQELYVDINAVADGATGAQTAPYATVQEALDATNSTGHWTIHLASGNYATGEPTLAVADSRRIVLQGPKGQTVTLGNIGITSSVDDPSKELRLQNLTVGDISISAGTELQSIVVEHCIAGTITGFINLYIYGQNDPDDGGGSFYSTQITEVDITGTLLSYSSFIETLTAANSATLDDSNSDIVDITNGITLTNKTGCTISGTVDQINSESGSSITVQDTATVQNIIVEHAGLRLEGALSGDLEATASEIRIDTSTATIGGNLEFQECNISITDVDLSLGGTLFRMVQCVQHLNFSDLTITFTGAAGRAFVDAASKARHWDNTSTVSDTLTIVNGTLILLDAPVVASSAGSAGWIQYSDGAGGFDAEASLAYDDTTNRLAVGSLSTTVFEGVFISGNTNNQAVNDQTARLELTNSSGGSFDLTGLTGRVHGRKLKLGNSAASTGAIVLKNESASSTSGNRFRFGQDITLNPGDWIEIIGDDSSGGSNLRWELNTGQLATGVSSFNTRTGAVVPAASDYTSDQVDNASTVTGATVSDALETLDSGKSDVGHTHVASDIGDDSSSGVGPDVASTIDDLYAAVSATAAGAKVKGTVKGVFTTNTTLSGLAQVASGSIAVDTDGDLVLVTANTTLSENGLWVAHSGAWTRPSNFTTGSSAAGSWVIVEQGTTTGDNPTADSQWLCTNDTGSDVIDTDDLDWTQIPHHQLSSSNPPNIADSSTSPGTSSLAARGDHQHAHGSRGGGTLHAVAVAGVSAGFLSGTDKAKIDGIPTGGVTADNVGTGSGVFRDKTSGVLHLRTFLSADTNLITITENTDDLTFDLPNVTIASGFVSVGIGTGTSGSGSLLLGDQAGANSTGTGNTIVGSGSAGTVTTGASNTVVGNSSAGSMTGNANLVLGSGSATALAGGSGNIILGTTAATLTTGNNNILIGANANTPAAGTSSYLDINASLIVFSGFVGLGIGVGTTGSGSTYVGDQAGASCTGAGNTLIGGNAGTALTSGVSNTALGNGAASSMTGNSNTVLGASAGTSLTGGSGNTIIGVTTTTLTTGNSNVLIGTGADTPSASQSSFLALTDLLTGDLSANRLALVANALGDVLTQAANVGCYSSVDTSSPFAVTSAGANAGTSKVFVGDRDPTGNVTGNPGDLYIRSSGALSTLFQHKGTSSDNTSWVNTATTTAPTKDDKNLVCLAVSTDGAKATNSTMSHTSDGYVQVYLHGVGMLVVGDGTKTGCDCFWTTDSGSTAEASDNVPSGAELFYNAIEAGLNLTTNHRLSFFYNA